MVVTRATTIEQAGKQILFVKSPVVDKEKGKKKSNLLRTVPAANMSILTNLDILISRHSVARTVKKKKQGE